MVNLLQNCRTQDLHARNAAHYSCITGNVCGFVSLTCWFCTLLFQVCKNHKEHQWPKGLSLYWAKANFTASLFNVFFVFSLNLPIYSLILAVYMPIVETYLLWQAFYYMYIKKSSNQESEYTTIDEEKADNNNDPNNNHNNNFETKETNGLKVWCLFLFVWIIIIGIGIYQLFFLLKIGNDSYDSNDKNNNTTIANIYGWIALFIYSVEMIPQLYTNLYYKAYDSQSKLMLLTTCIGKLSDFLYAFCLKMPIQTKFLAFASASMAYINVTQILYYYLKNCDKNRLNINRRQMSANENRNDINSQLGSITELSKSYSKNNNINNNNNNNSGDNNSIDGSDDEIDTKYIYKDSTCYCDKLLIVSLLAISLTILSLFIVGLCWDLKTDYSLSGVATVYLSLLIVYCCVKIRHRQNKARLDTITQKSNIEIKNSNKNEKIDDVIHASI